MIETNKTQFRMNEEYTARQEQSENEKEKGRKKGEGGEETKWHAVTAKTNSSIMDGVGSSEERGREVPGEESGEMTYFHN